MSDLPFCSSQEAIRRMNEWGRYSRPFFFLIDADRLQCLVESPENLPSHGSLLYAFPHHSNVTQISTPRPDVFRWEPHPQSFESYARSFQTVHGNLRAGNSFLVNLTCATEVDTDLSLRRIFEHADARYRLLLEDRFVVFSPETFVRISHGHIYSYPMKGTIDASLPDAARTLLADEKEAAEHATITDLIRNDLSRVAEQVTVTRYRYLDRLHTHAGPLLQMSSEIRGKLPSDYPAHLGDLFFRLLPAGSVTGAPKRKTVEIIHEAETYSRGFYTGVMGYFDGETLDSAVLIRFLEKLPSGRLVFKSGGGITFRSTPEAEYREMIRKIYVPVY